MRLRFALLLCVGLIQLAVPGWMAYEQEQILRHGAEYKFETEPVDPYDLFRGRYVALRFKAQTVKQKPGAPEFPRNSKVYVAVKVNEAGFAEVERISLQPIAGDNVFQAKVWWTARAHPPKPGEPLKSPDDLLDKLHLEFPFHEYFMEESLAPQAEQAYRTANREKSKQKAWAIVRLRHGKAALSDLILDGQPIRDYLRDHPQSKP